MSCVGRCSLTVALPIISACGVEACPMPTALLSTHTAFSSFTFLDLSDEMLRIADEFQKQQIDFDGIYTGYLGSVEQVNEIIGFIEMFGKKDTLVLVDPAMADNGKLYAGFKPDFPQTMAELCKKADIIVPNITEASFILGGNGTMEYSSRDDVKKILERLASLGPDIAVLTGVEEGDKLGAALYDKKNDKFVFSMRDRIPRQFHGTGDIFASVLFGAMMHGNTLEEALDASVDFVCESMKKTMQDENLRWYGVNFEEVLRDLPKMLEKK